MPLFNQHIQRRSVTTAPSLFLNPANRAFYKNLLSKLCPVQKIVFSVVKAEGKAIAFHFGFCDGRTLLYYKPTFDLDLAAHSPGKVLLKEVLEHALAQDCQEFDFSVGQEAYKMDFANHMKTNCSFKVLKTPVDYGMSRLKALIRGKHA